MKLLTLLLFLNLFFSYSFSHMYQHEHVDNNDKSLFTSSDSPHYSTTLKPATQCSDKLHKHMEDFYKDIYGSGEVNEEPIILKPKSYTIEDGYLNIHFKTNEKRNITIQTSKNIYSYITEGVFTKIDVTDMCYESMYLHMIIQNENLYERVKYIRCEELYEPRILTVLFNFYVQSALYFTITVLFLFYIKTLYLDILSVNHDHYRNDIHELLHPKSDDDNQNNNNHHSSYNKYKHHKFYNYKLYRDLKLVICIFIFFYSIKYTYGAPTCDAYHIVSNGFTQSIERNDYSLNETVSVVGYYNLKLPSTSFSICLSIDDNDNTTLPVILNLKFTYSLQTKSNYLYHSCFHEVISATKVQCFGNGGCGKGKCGGIKPMDQDAQGELTKFDAAKYFGHSFCDDPYTNMQLKCGGVHLGSTGCIYGKYSHKPVSDFFPSYDVISTIPIYKVEATLDGNKIYSIGINDPKKDINIMISATAVPNDLSMNGRTYTVIGGKAFFGQVAKTNNPIAGIPGDFQCNEDDAKNQRWHKCAIANGIVTDRTHKRNGKNVKTTFDYVECGATKLKEYPTAPGLRFGNSIWSMTPDHVLYTYPNTHEPIDVFIEFKKKLNISRLLKKATPEVKFIRNLVSCRACLNESAFEVEVKSISNPGRVLISTKDTRIDLLTKVIDITRDPKRYIIRYSTQTPQIDTDFYFAPNVSVHINIELKLPYYTLFSNMIKSFYANSSKDGDDGEPNKPDFCLLCIIKKALGGVFGFWLDFWKSILKLDFKKWLLIIGLVLIAAITVLVIVKRVYFKIFINRFIK